MAFTFFFRDLQTLELMRDYAVPAMRTRRYIRIWDAGCAMGPEPYTIAIILRENMGQMIFRNVTIHATDIDTCDLFGPIIDAGVYPREQVERIPKELLQRYFIPDEARQRYQLSDEIRKSVSFRKHDLVSLQPFRSDFNLVICKNVLLHLSEKQRVEVIKMFHQTLEPGGFFLTEQTQKMPPECAHLFEPVVSNAQIFRKV